MRRVQFLVSALLLVLLLTACAPAVVPAPAPAVPVVPPAAAPAPRSALMPAKPAWEVEWDKVVEAAVKEGRLMAVAQFGPGITRALGEAFKSRFGIGSQWLAGTSSELAVRIKAERRVGIYSTDVGIIGHITPYNVLKPAGALDSLDKVLFLPDLTDPQEIKKMWRFGQLWWVDQDHTILVMVPNASIPLVINTQLVKPEEMKSYRDLLNPKWKGKISLVDPTVGSGFATTWALVVGSEIMGWNYLRQLVEQEPFLTRDKRLSGEWVARGKYAIGIAVSPEVVQEFTDLGSPLQRLVPEEGTHLSSAGGTITLMKDAPHPNAAKLFINWLLSKEGQTVYSKAAAVPSGRLDVSTEGLDPFSIPDPKMRYVESYSEKAIREQAENMKMVTEIFGKLKR